MEISKLRERVSPREQTAQKKAGKERKSGNRKRGRQGQNLFSTFTLLS